jgi:hypothetical protein
VLYQIITTVINAEGVAGGTAQLQTTGAAEVRKRTAALAGQIVTKSPITARDVVGNQLRVILGFNRPCGRHAFGLLRGGRPGPGIQLHSGGDRHR